MDNFDFPKIWDISYIISHSQHDISLFLHKKHLKFRIYNISKMPLSHLFSRKQRAGEMCAFLIVPCQFSFIGIVLRQTEDILF